MYVSGIELAFGLAIGKDAFAAFRSLLSDRKDSLNITEIVCQELWEKSLRLGVKAYWNQANSDHQGLHMITLFSFLFLKNIIYLFIYFGCSGS